MKSLELLKAVQPPLNLETLPTTKLVRNFICDHLFDDKLLLSYAPSGEFGGVGRWSWIVGCHICNPDSFDPLEPQVKINFRIIRELFNSGIIKVKRDIDVPNVKIVVFEWSDSFNDDARTALLLSHILSPVNCSTRKLIDGIARFFGLSVKFAASRGLFEILTDDGKRIRNGAAVSTYIFTNEQGEPVTGWRDLSPVEWYHILLKISQREGTKNDPQKLSKEDVSFFSCFKKNR